MGGDKSLSALSFQIPFCKDLWFTYNNLIWGKRRDMNPQTWRKNLKKKKKKIWIIVFQDIPEIVWKEGQTENKGDTLIFTNVIPFSVISSRSLPNHGFTLVLKPIVFTQFISFQCCLHTITINSQYSSEAGITNFIFWKEMQGTIFLGRQQESMREPEIEIRSSHSLS